MRDQSLPSQAHPASPNRLVEGIVRVVRAENGRLVLEPEQTTSCGSCASAATCASRDEAGIGSVSSRLQARQFVIDAPGGAGSFDEGERLVVGIAEVSLFRASLTAYGLPLAFALVAASMAQAAYGEDGLTMLAMAAGLAVGMLLARVGARRLAARGELAPRVLRRAKPGESCGS